MNSILKAAAKIITNIVTKAEIRSTDSILIGNEKYSLQTMLLLAHVLDTIEEKGVTYDKGKVTENNNT